MLQPGEEIDIWVVEKALGAGGMGSVYRCHNRNATRILAAVKVLESSLRRHPESEARFIREAEILFHLDHPNIVKVRNVRTDTDPPYLEMEFVRGESLEGLLRRGALSLAQGLDLMQQIASATAYLHSTGVRHRDIKPANLVVDERGTIKLVDFGLAMEADVSRLTQQGMTFGTVSYAPPEWITPDTLDPERWDIYAAGVVFWEMLTGRLAFPVSGQGSARQQAMQVIVGKQTTPALDPGEDFDDEVRALIRSMTEKDPTARPASAAEVLDITRGLIERLCDPDEVVPLPQLTEELPRSFTADRPARPGSSATWVAAPSEREQPIEPTLAPPTRPSTRSISPGGGAMVAMGAVVAAGILALALMVVAGALLAPRFMGGGLRDVDLIVNGPAADAPLAVQLGNLVPSSRDGAVFHFISVPPGSHQLSWVLGDDCPQASCPGEACPSWCGTGSAVQQVPEGEGVAALTLSITLPPAAEVVLALPAVDLPISLTLGGVPGTRQGDSLHFAAVPPGKPVLSGAIGDCPTTALGCWPDGDCPDGCISLRQALTVGWGQERVTVDLALPAPRLRTKSKGAKSKGAKGKGAKSKGAKSKHANSGQRASGKAVTNAQFARWLAKHADWHRQAAIDAKRADDNYLTGWTELSPPGPGAAVHVSWYAAAAYCRSHGGLASVDAEPQRWPEGPDQPYIEWRRQDGKAAWRSNDGRVSFQVGMKQTTPLTGFRCAH